MKKGLAIVLGLFSLTSFSQIDSLRLPDEVNQTNWRGQKEGVWVSVYPNSQVEFITQYDNDKKDGFDIHLSAAGIMMSQELYEDGQLHGLQRYFDNAGNVKSELTYAHGLKNGVEWAYYPGTRNLKEESHWVNGVKSGVSKWYYSQGGVSAVYNYVNGEIEGEATYYYPEGSIKQILNYVQSRRTGFYEMRYPNGNKKEVGEFQDNERVGTWYFYSENGELLRTEEHKAKTE